MANIISEIFHHGEAKKPVAVSAPAPQSAAPKETTVATTAATPAPAITGQVLPPTTAVPAPRLSFIKKVAADAKAVFAWLGQPKVQQTVLAAEALGEGIANAINPGLSLLDPLINNWTQEIFKAQALAAAALVPDGNGEQKAAMVLNALTPQVVQFAEANKLPAPTGDKLLQANTLLYNFLEILGGGEPTTPAPAPSTTA